MFNRGKFTCDLSVDVCLHSWLFNHSFEPNFEHIDRLVYDVVSYIVGEAETRCSTGDSTPWEDVVEFLKFDNTSSDKPVYDGVLNDFLRYYDADYIYPALGLDEYGNEPKKEDKNNA